jgi:hypothetical protein
MVLPPHTCGTCVSEGGLTTSAADALLCGLAAEPERCPALPHDLLWAINPPRAGYETHTRSSPRQPASTDHASFSTVIGVRA